MISRYIRKSVFLFSVFVLSVFMVVKSVSAQNPQITFEAKVIEIIEEKIVDFEGQRQLYQAIRLLVLSGELKDRSVIVENGLLSISNSTAYKVNDRVVVMEVENIDGGVSYFITDYVRKTPLLTLFILFCIIAVTIGRWAGLASLIGMGYSFFIIFYFIIPKIMNGADAVLIAILGSIFIVPVTFGLSHGLNKKTLIAMVGTFLSLAITGVLAVIFVEYTKLTGFASEEASFLAFDRADINIKGLLLAGIIIGVLGVLDDITVSQASIVKELQENNPKIKISKLFSSAMSVGRDHIASLINTLVLVYTGASLPLLLLFVNTSKPFTEIINYEILADEIVRTLVGSIGLIMAVPITTLLAVYVANRHKL